MKAKFTRLFSMTAGVVLLLSNSLSAQNFDDPKYAVYGNSAAEREANIKKYNIFNDAVKLNNIPLALDCLRELLDAAPKCSENLYIKGATIYKKKIATTKDPKIRDAYKDSLLRLYDIRLANFGDEEERGAAYIKQGKAREALKYFADDPVKLQAIVHDALATAGPKADIKIIPNYIQILSNGYANDVVETDMLLNEYDFASGIITKSGAPEPEKNETKEIIDKMFLNSGAANCENLEKLFKPQYEADPNNEELITKILRYFAQNDCNTEFSALIAEKHYAIKPSASAAVAIAGSYANKKEYDKAFEYYDQALNLEESAHEKSLYATRAAGTALLAENPRKAADYARKAISNNDKNGFAYLTLGQAYAAGANGCDGFIKQALFWLVVDNLTKARSLMEDQPDQIERINEMIAAYTKYFPSTEDIFMETLKPGDSFTVNCGWVSGTTTVRER